MITGLMVLAHAAVPAVLAFGTLATAGVGIQPGPVCAATTVAQGGTYTLPPVQVADTGSGDVDISLAVIRQTGRSTLHGRPVPPRWVTFTYPGHWFGMVAGSSIHASPGESPLVPAQLNIPSSAPTGPYVAWIEPYPAGSDTPGLSNIGTGVAPLEFTVTKAGTPARHVTCVNPDAAPAKPAPPPPSGHRHHRARGAAAAAGTTAPPAASGISGKQVLLGGGGVVVVAVFLIRRRRTA